MTITKREAIAIINQHGWGPAECTAYHSPEELNEDNECACEDGWFYHDVGNKPFYTTREIKNWLGY